MEEGLCSLDQNRIVRVNYRKICSDPLEIADQIVVTTNRLGADVSEVGNAPHSFTPTDIKRVSDDDFEKICGAVGQYFNPTNLE